MAFTKHYSSTKGVKNTLNSEKTPVAKFWELNKLAKTQIPENKVRSNIEMINLAKEIVENKILPPTDKFFAFIERYSRATIIENDFHKPLWIKLPPQTEGVATTPSTKQAEPKPSKKFDFEKPKEKIVDLPEEPAVSSTSKTKPFKI